MKLDINKLRKRLRETFGNDSQEVIGKKLNMTQGNVSKLLSGTQQPTLDTVYTISEVYDISVDWLLGLTEKRKIHEYDEGITYSSTARTLFGLVSTNSIEFVEADETLSVVIRDPLMRTLILKGKVIATVDSELYDDWLEKRLSIFDNCPIVNLSKWEQSEFADKYKDLNTESAWAELYDCVSGRQKNC